ncbi:MAG: DUF2721 domain-containing protein [Planctomycetota bacterium]|nr:DUF2721 domain-containing protein [Planctomycetota bacterium]
MLVASEVIDILIGPVVMISANGLLCLAFYNRLANVMCRCRAINKERVDLATELAARSAEQLKYPRALQWKRRAEVLDAVGGQLFRRAWWVRRVLYCLLLAVLCLLACSLTLGFSLMVPSMASASLAFFILGTLMMMLGGVVAIKELHLALDPLLFETAHSGSMNVDSLGVTHAPRRLDAAQARVLQRNAVKPGDADAVEADLEQLANAAKKLRRSQ